MPINEKEFEKMANSPSTREIIEQLRANGWTVWGSRGNACRPLTFPHYKASKQKSQVLFGELKNENLYYLRLSNR